MNSKQTKSVYEVIDYKAENHNFLTDEEKLLRIELENIDDHADDTDRIQSSLANTNYRTRQIFSNCFKLPEWSNPFIYWYNMPTGTSRLTTWEEIGTAFKLTVSQRLNLQELENQTNLRGRIKYTDYTKKDKSRIVQQLLKKQVVKIIEHLEGDDFVDVIVLNPSIVYGRSWWSPFMQGVMLVEWMNNELKDIKLAHIHSKADHCLTHVGTGAAVGAGCEHVGTF